MTLEEKAKAYDKIMKAAVEAYKYDKALKAAVVAYKDEDKHLKATLETIFPELKESEDERFIKALKEGFKYHKLFNPTFGGISCIEIENWLDKKGEKKSSDEVLKIRQEVYQSGYSDGYKHGIEDGERGEKKHKFNIGDIISDNNAIFRVDNIVKNCIGQDCYFLVNVKSEKDGTRYLKLFDSDGKTHNMGEITWLCEQVDAKFILEGE